MRNLTIVLTALLLSLSTINCCKTPSGIVKTERLSISVDKKTVHSLDTLQIFVVHTDAIKDIPDIQYLMVGMPCPKSLPMVQLVDSTTTFGITSKKYVISPCWVISTPYKKELIELRAVSSTDTTKSVTITIYR